VSPGHGTSLATTAGITSVISLVAVVSLMAQGQALSGWARTGFAAGLAVILLGAGLLYLARGAVGRSLDFQASGQGEIARRYGERALWRYHLGMALLFAGLALTAAGRYALPAAASGLLSLCALWRTVWPDHEVRAAEPVPQAQSVGPSR